MPSINALKLYGLLIEVPAFGAPPSVRPAVVYAGGAAPESFTAASTAFVRPRGSAPLIVLMTAPFLKIMNVGML